MIKAKQQGGLATPERFPEEKIQTEVEATDGRSDQYIVLTQHWKPLWDTRPLSKDGKSTFFFTRKEVIAGGAWPERSECNHWANVFSWPDRFYLWEMAFYFGFCNNSSMVADYVKEQETLLKTQFERDTIVRIGAEYGSNNFEMPLWAFLNPRPGEYRVALAKAYLIPPEREFHLSMQSENFHKWREGSVVRCVLHGYLVEEKKGW